jgi:two-component system sensor histidine kinase EvgS
MAGDTEQIPEGQGETVLLVEDEPAIMKMSKIMLENRGYRVLAANKPGEAIRYTSQHSGKIHLLITDVIMPEMNGRDLADQLHTPYPDIRVLFMSGCTADVIARHGVLDKNVHFIQKPFSKKDIAVMIRKVLEQV